MFKSPSNPNSWRRYQQKLKRIARIKTLFDKLPWIGTGMIVLMLFFFVFLHLNLFWFFREEKKVQSPTQETKKNQIEAIQNAKAVASRLLEAQDLDFSPLLQEYFFQAEEGKFRVETAVEIGLQNYIEKNPATFSDLGRGRRGHETGQRPGPGHGRISKHEAGD